MSEFCEVGNLDGEKITQNRLCIVTNRSVLAQWSIGVWGPIDWPLYTLINWSVRARKWIKVFKWN
jgi:hypothetical protein